MWPGNAAGDGGWCIGGGCVYGSGIQFCCVCIGAAMWPGNAAGDGCWCIRGLCVYVYHIRCCGSGM